MYYSTTICKTKAPTLRQGPTGQGQVKKIKSCAYIQLGEKALQTLHQTFQPNIPVIFHLLA